MTRLPSSFAGSLFGVFLMTSCTSTKPVRPLPSRIESCEEVAKRVQARDAFYGSLKGSATLVARSRSIDIEAGLVSGERLPEVVELRDSGLARLEIVGPLGIRLGLVVLNPKWLYVFSIPEQTVYRFPSSELTQDTLRREALFRKFPIRISPDLFFRTFLTRVGLGQVGLSPSLKLDCDFDREAVAYRLRLPAAGRGGRLVWVDPAEFYPLRVLDFDTELPALSRANEGALRPVSETTYERTVGGGLATLPSKILVRLEPSGERLEFSWRQAQAWPNFDVSVFEWAPPSSAKIVDL